MRIFKICGDRNTVLCLKIETPYFAMKRLKQKAARLVAKCVEKADENFFERFCVFYRNSIKINFNKYLRLKFTDLVVIRLFMKYSVQGGTKILPQNSHIRSKVLCTIFENDNEEL